MRSLRSVATTADMIFASDNWSGASDRVIAALADAARKGGPAYGNDAITKAVEERIADVFEHEVAVFLVASGTAANALSLAAYARPGGVVFCHHEAHINVDEAGAVHFFGNGMQVHGLDAAAGKIAPETLTEGIASLRPGDAHQGQPVALNITNITELGAAYSPDEVAALVKIARSREMAVHMDGARFANAVIATGASPAELTWKAGVDVLSFGGTKNGCIAAEAVVFFNPAHARDVPYARQRAGQGFSKNWFIAAQLDAYLRDGHWLELARHSNATAAKLAGALSSSGRARLAFRPDGNEVFAILENGLDEKLRAAGAKYHPWVPTSLPVAERPGAGETMVRLVTSWQTTAADVDKFAALLR
ncbi:MAG TPA: low specificity L-threonine aldolase [Bauldia sp.]|nr:low specificity L-threonine aldolase [Bauldia sp.]